VKQSGVLGATTHPAEALAKGEASTNYSSPTRQSDSSSIRWHCLRVLDYASGKYPEIQIKA
jgi:hypothetical protein